MTADWKRFVASSDCRLVSDSGMHCKQLKAGVEYAIPPALYAAAYTSGECVEVMAPVAPDVVSPEPEPPSVPRARAKRVQPVEPEPIDLE